MQNNKATGAELGKTQAANCCKQHVPSQREERSDGIARLQAENTAAEQAETTEDRATSITGSSDFSIQQTNCRGRKRVKSGFRGLVHAAIQTASVDESHPVHEAHRNAARRWENPGYTTPPYNHKGGRPHTVCVMELLVCERKNHAEVPNSACYPTMVQK